MPPTLLIFLRRPSYTVGFWSPPASLLGCSISTTYDPARAGFTFSK